MPAQMREVESGAEPKLISAGTNRKEKKKPFVFCLSNHTLMHYILTLYTAKSIHMDTALD